MKNNNGRAVRRLSARSLRSNRLRNLFAVAAIALTCMMFTALSSMGIGMMQVAQEQTMREVGSRCHAGLKDATKEQMEKITADPRIIRYNWNILIGFADNILHRQSEIRCPSGEEMLYDSFIELTQGRLPQTADELVVDTIVLDELGVRYETGALVPLTFTFMGQKYEKTFKLSGWYRGDAIAHASQLYVSEAFWEELCAGRSDEDFIAWEQEHPENQGIGLYSVGLWFKDSNRIEETVRSVIGDAGYEPGEELGYGVNWAYMSSRASELDIGSVALLVAGLVIILLTGYLIIYNIFQISVVGDIRFYGLLKTIGMTGRQLRHLIRRQALILSAVGIPAGLAAGIVAGKVLLPFSMRFMDMGGMKVELHFEPLMLLFGTVFSLVTVLIGCRKPAKIAGKVSPVEAVRYSEGSVKRKKEKRSTNGAKVWRMALSNLGRNRKRTVFVVLSLSLSITMLCVVLTFADSFRIEMYLGERLIGDIIVGTTGYTDGVVNGDFEIDPQMTETLDAQQGITARYEMWASAFAKTVALDEEAFKEFSRLCEEGVLETQDENRAYAMEQVLQNRELDTDVYAYDTSLLEHLKVLEGTLDLAKFEQGGYILLSTMSGTNGEISLYKPGEKVTVRSVTENTQFEEIKDEMGGLLGYRPVSGIEEKEYEVMAIVDAPSCMDQGYHSMYGIEMIFPKSELSASRATGYCFAVSYSVGEDALEKFTEVTENYTKNENPLMGYRSKQKLVQEFSGMQKVVGLLGASMCIVITVIGVLNFVNSIFTGIVARKREFAILCSIGMTGKQLQRMLILEGVYYVLISGAAGAAAGSLAAWGILYALNQVIRFFSYRYNGWAFVIMLPLLIVIAVGAPVLMYGRMRKESIVERLRDTEG